MEGEIKRLKRELQCEGAITKYYKDTVLLPNGNTAVWDFVGHNGAAAVVPVLEDGRLLMVTQYRNALDRFTLEIPAGGLNPGEPTIDAAARELKEETGLTFHPIEVDEMYSRPYFTTIGMTDESCAAVYGAADGVISRNGLEDGEEIEVVLADRTEIRRILKEENVSLMCAYMMMHFLYEDPEKPFGFLHAE